MLVTMQMFNFPLILRIARLESKERNKVGPEETISNMNAGFANCASFLVDVSDHATRKCILLMGDLPRASVVPSQVALSDDKKSLVEGHD